jgi:hypothetical protein
LTHRVQRRSRAVDRPERATRARHVLTRRRVVASDPPFVRRPAYDNFGKNGKDDTIRASSRARRDHRLLSLAKRVLTNSLTNRPQREKRRARKPPRMAALPS